ncbi:hypothetical protein [Ruegeria arenilitoris]|uniref:hypothetical protein n=1 Tax=Ruegeria arenilitoris TaxID=1173585 RepID=UPI001595ED27|nr:hypothetical protein [Ruegeria arenilitoris]
MTEYSAFGPGIFSLASGAVDIRAAPVGTPTGAPNKKWFLSQLQKPFQQSVLDSIGKLRFRKTI